jgi:hypothetical protein
MAGPPSPAQEKDKAAPAARWEYRVVGLAENDQEAEDALNKLGDEGWDLAGTAGEVSARPVPQGSGRVSTRVRLVLKRPKK